MDYYINWQQQNQYHQQYQYVASSVPIASVRDYQKRPNEQTFSFSDEDYPPSINNFYYAQKGKKAFYKRSLLDSPFPCFCLCFFFIFKTFHLNQLLSQDKLQQCIIITIQCIINNSIM